MTKIEWMAQFENELHKRKVTDAAEIAEEYGQHFAYKLADGYSEEEIAAKLGNPVELAAQFEPTSRPAKRSAVLTWLWLGWADLFFGILEILLISFGIVLISCVLAFGVTGICLIGNLGRLPIVSLPPMPYGCGAILGIALSALCALSVIGCLWFFAFLRQTFRAYKRFHQNALAPGRGAAALPALSVIPSFSPEHKRRLRTVALVSLVLFALCFVISYIVCSLVAGSLEFWHVWGWFSA